MLNIPKAAPGMPEAGLQLDIFGQVTEYHPKPNAIFTQETLDDALKLKGWNETMVDKEVFKNA